MKILISVVCAGMILCLRPGLIQADDSNQISGSSNGNYGRESQMVSDNPVEGSPQMVGGSPISAGLTDQDGIVKQGGQLAPMDPNSGSVYVAGISSGNSNGFQHIATSGAGVGGSPSMIDSNPWGNAGSSDSNKGR